MNEQINRIKQKFPTGTRIELIALEDPYTKLQPGDTGTVDFIGEDGTIHMNWDTGSNLALIPMKIPLESSKSQNLLMFFSSKK